MEKLKTNWKLSGKTKNPRSQQAAGKLKIFWKQQRKSKIFLKKVENQTAGERASAQNPQIKKPNRQKTVGQHCKTRLENLTTQAPIFGDITKKKGCDNIFVTAFWWELVDSNHRSIKQQIYSLSPLATREHAHILFVSHADRLYMITPNSLLVNN